MVLVGVLLMMVVTPVVVGVTSTDTVNKVKPGNHQPYIILLMKQGGGDFIRLLPDKSYTVVPDVPLRFKAIYVWKVGLLDNEKRQTVLTEGEEKAVIKAIQKGIESKDQMLGSSVFPKRWKVNITENDGTEVELGSGYGWELKWNLVEVNGNLYLVAWTPPGVVDLYTPSQDKSPFDVAAIWNKWCWGSSILTIEGIVVVPEPTTLALTALGMLGVLGFVRRRREA
ncbi:MAG: PEP-CTERM bacterial domain protein [Candidatus Syntrophoarchaeum caldarius]|uniref:PEP-CTERM bacterial domain protein n=1 Tax=Candidatus Syntropharchaeum caldarium TaxID=1838285 RepID=A0A1F2PCN8_9EURY|nr:MAG: PEP-CTERM bacterial domain protein [Candidatus Syntrophoarchaeum caldarius]